ncbi:MAG: class I SAM-dependent methyltransferase [Bacteroidales bacterium]|nr:class I SAM-dependent methyltransferase [Bacteroidales bacterium]
MKYEPIKASIGNVFNKHPQLRILLYKLLNILLLRTWHIKKQLRKLFPLLGPHANILDAGSGFGQYSYFLSRFSDNWRITGVDINEKQVNDCNLFFKKIGYQHRVNFKTADLTNFNEPEQYHLILSVDVMEHIEEDQKVFKNFFNSLREGGMVLISTPSDKGGSDAHSHDDDSFIEEHVRNGYSIEDISQKLYNAGFKRVDCMYQYGKPGSLSWKLSMKFPIIMLNKSKLLFIVLPVYYLLVMPICLILNYLDTIFEHQTGTGLIVVAYK